MNLLVMSHMFPNKSAPYYGIFVYEQIKSLLKSGMAVQVVSPVPYSPSVLWFRSKWKDYGTIPFKETLDLVTVFHPRYLAFPKRIMFEKSGWLYYLGMKKVLNDILEKNALDLVHAHTVLPDGQAAMYIRRQYGIPYVVTIHGDDLYNTINQSYKRKSAIEDVLNESSKIIIVGSSLRKIILSNFHKIQAKNILVINNGVDINKFNSPARSYPNRNKFKILSVGSLIERKGHTLVLEVLGELSGKLSVEYMIVGDGQERARLEQSVKEKGLSKIVKFHGSKAPNEIPKFMKDSDLFVLPSWDEGFGVVYLEAMASGLPIIASKEQGIEDVIRNGENGFLVKPGDSDNLLEICEKVISNRSLYERISKEAIKTASSYTWDKNAQETLKIYNQVLENKT